MKDKIIKLVAQCRRFLSQFVRVKKVKQLPKVKLSVQKKANALTGIAGLDWPFGFYSGYEFIRSGFPADPAGKITESISSRPSI